MKAHSRAGIGLAFRNCLRSVLMLIAAGVMLPAVTLAQVEWTGVYEADVLPLDDGWISGSSASNDFVEVNGGLLHLQTSATNPGSYWWQRNVGLNDQNGWTVEWRMRVIQGGSPADIDIWMSAAGYYVDHSESALGFFASGTSIPLDQTVFRTYRIAAQGGQKTLYIDGVDSGLPTFQAFGGSTILFGDGTSRNNAPVNESEWDYIAWYLGAALSPDDLPSPDDGPADADGDGVDDPDDLCPGTAAGASVDANGCSAAQLDSDGDGVNDDVDLCPLTDAGAVVDASGCTDDDVDTDGDGICDSGAPSGGPSGCTGSDNCPLVANNGQEDADSDGAGDACDSDDDNDGVPDGSDNCPLTLGGNTDQTDTDSDGAGDICDADLDGDGVDNIDDVCPNDPDPDQTDTDMDGDGDACDANDDGDDFDDVADNCPLDVNNGQEDLDGDNIGDACDADLDGDGVDNDDDNCPVTLGGDGNQTDTDTDGQGDVCDDDDDNDSILDGDDNCPLAANTSQGDADGDGIGDACNDADDADGDEWSDTLDNCPNDANGDQADLDADGTGDACDSDIDGDGVDNDADDCAATPQGELSDASGCTIAQLCPCDGPRGTTKPWKNHGKYVSCVAHAANDFRDAGLITGEEHGDIVSAAGQSDCGRR